MKTVDFPRYHYAATVTRIVDGDEWPLFPASSGDDSFHVVRGDTEPLSDVTPGHRSSKRPNFRNLPSREFCVLVPCVSQWLKVVGPNTRFLFAAVVQFVSGRHSPILAFPANDMGCSVPPIDTYHHVPARVQSSSASYPARGLETAILDHIIRSSPSVSMPANEANRLTFDVTMFRNRCNRNARLPTTTALTKTFGDSIVWEHFWSLLTGFWGAMPGAVNAALRRFACLNYTRKAYGFGDFGDRVRGGR